MLCCLAMFFLERVIIFYLKGSDREKEIFHELDPSPEGQAAARSKEHHPVGGFPGTGAGMEQ